MLEIVEDNVEKEKMPAFSPFPTMFAEGFLSGVLRLDMLTKG